MMKKLLLVLVLVLCVASTAFAKPLKLGESFFVNIPDSFVEGDMSEEDIAEGQTGYYKSDDTSLDFDVYYIKDAGALEKFIADDAAEVKGTDIVTGKQINGIAIASYKSVQDNEGEKYNVLTYAFADKGGCVKIDFWLDGDNAGAEANAIINTLSR